MDFVYYNPISNNIQKHQTHQFTIQHITKKYKKEKYKQDSLYDIYASRFHREILPKKLEVPSSTIYTETFQIKRTLRRHRLFMETEYLEDYYEEISMFISPDKTATIEASKLKNNIPSEKEDSGSHPLQRMPIFAFCKGILPSKNDSLTEPSHESPVLPEKLIMVFPAEYPKSPFYLYINDVLYTKKIHCCHLERVKQSVGKYMKSYRPFVNCISCACTLHNTNWRPNTYLSDILNEYAIIQQLKEIVKYDILLGELMNVKQLDYSIVVWIMEYLYTPSAMVWK
jgi:hypothetical protein